MATALRQLIADYQAAVATAVRQLCDELHLEPPASDIDWACNNIPQRGTLSDGARYFKHGYGCAVKYTGGSVDFDFGPHGEITGFDAFRLWSFAQSRHADYGFPSEAALAAAIQSAESRGELRHSGYLLYFLGDPKA